MERPIAIQERVGSFDVPLQTGPALSLPRLLTVLFFRYGRNLVACRAEYDSAGGLCVLRFECPHCATRLMVTGRHLILSGGWRLSARSCLLCIDRECDFHVALAAGVTLPCREAH